ncbi:MAG: enoyl-CoA hydratase-related protein [Polyangiaceae bacterium]
MRVLASEVGSSPYEAAFVRRLTQLLERVEREPAMRGLVLEIDGGLDRSSATFTPLAGAQTRAEVLAIQGAAAALVTRLSEFAKPVAAVLGHVVRGPWLELALAAHARVALSGGLELSLPEATLGLVPGLGGLVRVAATSGMEHAIELGMFGRTFDERSALAAGLVDEVAPREVAAHHAGAAGGAAHRAAQIAARLRPGRARGPQLSWLHPARAIPGYARVTLRDARSRARGWPGGESRAAQLVADVLEAFALRGAEEAALVERDAFAERALSTAARRTLALDAAIDARLGAARRDRGSATRVALLGHGADAVHTANGLAAVSMLVRLWDGRSPIDEAELVIDARGGGSTERGSLDLRALIGRAGPGRVVTTTAVDAPGEVLSLGATPRLYARRVEELVARSEPARASFARAAALFERHGRAAVLTRAPVARALLTASLDEARRLVSEGVPVDTVERALSEWGFATVAVRTAERAPTRRKHLAEEIQMRCALAFLSEAHAALERGDAASAEDIDLVAVHGAGFPAFRGGPFAWADEIGEHELKARFAFFERRHGPRFRPPRTLV